MLEMIQELSDQSLLKLQGIISQELRARDERKFQAGQYPELLQKERDILTWDNRIHAIKEYRERTGVSLNLAKMVIEATFNNPII